MVKIPHKWANLHYIKGQDLKTFFNFLLTNFTFLLPAPKLLGLQESATPLLKALELRISKTSLFYAIAKFLSQL